MKAIKTISLILLILLGLKYFDKIDNLIVKFAGEKTNHSFQRDKENLYLMSLLKESYECNLNGNSDQIKKCDNYSKKFSDLNCLSVQNSFGQVIRCFKNEKAYFIFRGTKISDGWKLRSEIKYNFNYFQLFLLFIITYLIIFVLRILSKFKRFIFIIVLSIICTAIPFFTPCEGLRYQESQSSLYKEIAKSFSEEELMSKKEIFFIGHSKGGAEANFLFKKMVESKVCNERISCRLITAGAPKVLNKVEIENINKKINVAKSIILINKADSVNMLTNFVGNLDYIKKETIEINHWISVLEIVCFALLFACLISLHRMSIDRFFNNKTCLLSYVNKILITFAALVSVMVFSLLTYHNLATYLNYFDL